MNRTIPRIPETHELKTWPKFFDAVVSGAKNFEIRKNDREFMVGDILLLKKYDNEKDEYMGEEIYLEITYILPCGSNFGIEEGYCIMGLKHVKNS